MRIWFLLLLSLFASPSFAADSQWHWIKATNTIENWSVSEGKAEVSIEGGRFKARLFWKNSDKDVQIILEGTITNGKITAKETIQESDYTGSVYDGTLHKKKWDNFAGTVGAESITLSDGWSLIGIKRTLLK